MKVAPSIVAAKEKEKKKEEREKKRREKNDVEAIDGTTWRN